MAERLPCPEPARWQDLLNGRLPEGEQAALAGHLETCTDCQQTLEGMAVDPPSLAQAIRHLSREPSAPPEALRLAMRRLTGESPATAAGPEGEGGPDLDFLDPPDGPGQLGRLGPYAVTGRLGRGGMGVVLKAFDPSLGRGVAIKVLAPHLARQETSRKRFHREARAAAAVRHEHVVTVHAVGEARGLPYLVMEHVEGVSLQEHLDRHGPLPLPEILHLGTEIASGLAAAHAQGLTHRDIKPANILLRKPATEDTEGTEEENKTTLSPSVPSVSSVAHWTPLITDFGLARAADEVGLTQSGVIAGTPPYMAPEQARGEPVDHRSDLFSLGSVLYAACTGRPPFQGEQGLAVLYQVCSEPPRPIRELNPAVPDWLEAVIDRLHAKDPADRYQSAAEVAGLLRQYLDHLREPSRVPLPQEPEKRPARPSAPPDLPPHLQKLLRRVIGWEYRSERTAWGWPLVHVAFGYDPQTGRKLVAKGIIAVGDVAVGLVAVGVVAAGAIGVGAFVAGLGGLGGLALGLLLAVGGAAVGGVAVGGVAVGLVAIGGVAVGYYALGGRALGVYALGANVQDPQAVEFFRSWLGSWVHQLTKKR
jgi:serine/threonine-protein kinase